MKRRSFLARGLAANLAPGLARGLARGLAGGLVTAKTLSADDSIAALLDQSFIWCAESVPVEVGEHERVNVADPQRQATMGEDCHAVFLTVVDAPHVPARASIHLFAYTRYRLYVNGSYVGRGPNRFQNQQPEYDSRDIKGLLQKGRNTVAILVHCDAPTGRIMRHQPGVSAAIELDGRRMVTGPEWRSAPELSFGPRAPAWASISEQIDARKMNDWLRAGFTGEIWKLSERVGGPSFAKLSPRFIPLQSETAVELHGFNSASQHTAAPFEVRMDCAVVVQAFHHLEFEADEGSELEVSYELPEGSSSGSSSYIARHGRQTWIGGDTFAMRWLRLKLVSGRMQLKKARVVEVRYPFERVASFQSNDADLNKLWVICARSLEILSEDAYVDCADRERVEWTDETPPAFQCTQVMMAGPAEGGKRKWGDARLQGALLRRIALTQQSDGQIKSHSCSDRWDIHAIMEDRSCDWVISIRDYFEATEDVALVREVWPAVVRLMNWFLAQRTARGLVQAREWEMWENPLRYQVCEGTGLNAFVYRALRDAAFLGHAVGEEREAARFEDAAAQLQTTANTLLWNESEGSYNGALIAADVKLNGPAMRKDFAGGTYPPTLIAALCALNNGLVPEARQQSVRSFMLAHQKEAFQVMSHHFLFEQLYALRTEAGDRRVLEIMREKWKPQVDSPWQTTWEVLDVKNEGSKVHVYGMVPGYYLSAYALGVRRSGAIGQRRVAIEPRPGDLMNAQGVAVTEFGPVSIQWKRGGAEFRAVFTVPEDVHATVRLPAYLVGPQGHVSVDGRHVSIDGDGVVEGTLPTGRHVLTCAHS